MVQMRKVITHQANSNVMDKHDELTLLQTVPVVIRTSTNYFSKEKTCTQHEKATIIVKNVGKVTNFQLFCTCPPRPWINVGQN